MLYRCSMRAYFLGIVMRSNLSLLKENAPIVLYHKQEKMKKFPQAKFEKSTRWHKCNTRIHKCAEMYALDEAYEKALDEGCTFSSQQEINQWIQKNMGYLEVYRECYDDAKCCYYSGASVPCTKCRVKCIECNIKVNCTYEVRKDETLKLFHGFLDAPNAPPSQLSSHARYLLRQQCI